MYLLYIDPGTGSMLFAALVGIVSTLFFFLQKFWLKLKFFLTGGRAKEDANAKKVPCVIFGEDGRYWNLFRDICEEMEARQMECEYYTMDEKDPVLQTGYEHIHPSFIGDGNRAFAKLNLMKAKVCLSTTPDLDVLQWKRSKNVDQYLHIYHAVDEGTGYRMFGMDFFDCILVSSEFQASYIRRMEEMRHLKPKDLPVVGSTYLDDLLRRAAEVKKDKDKDDIVVLLAPSWGESGILTRFGDRILEALVKTGYHIIIRPHPQTRKVERQILDPLKSKYPAGEKLEWDESSDNFGSLSRADVMISDFSGVVFDFALVFNKPVIFADTSFDKSPYDSAWFDEPLWRLQVLDQMGISLKQEDFPRMKEVIDGLIADDHFQKGRDRLREQVWQNRGASAKSVVDYLEAVLGEGDAAEEHGGEEKSA